MVQPTLPVSCWTIFAARSRAPKLFIFPTAAYLLRAITGLIWRLGDMWLLFATGLITGCYGLVVLIYVSIFSAVLFAVPLLIRKFKRVSAEKKRIANAENPREEKLKIQREKAAIHFAEDPDYMAFGPFLALGCAVFVIMEPFFFEKMFMTIKLFGVYF